MTHREESPFRWWSSALFDEACRRTDLNNQQLAEAIRDKLGRGTLNRQSIGAWRRGDQAVPHDVYLAALRIAGSWNFDLMAAVVAREPMLAREVMPEVRPDPTMLAHWMHTLGLITTEYLEGVIERNQQPPLAP